MIAADVDQEVRYALETHLAALVVATTGTTTLGASGSSYTRSSGSFVTDGFKVGDAVRATGFSGNTALAYVTTVTATLLTVDRTLGTYAAAGNRSVVAGIPETSWPGWPFAIPEGKTWVRCRVRNSVQRVIAVAGGNIQRHEGIFLIDVFAPYLSGAGLYQGERLAGAIRQHFRVTTSIIRPSITVRISGMQPGSLLENEDNLQWPVAPEWWCDAALV